jgi:hypothetical protein
LSHLANGRSVADDVVRMNSPLIDRDEVVAIVFGIADLNVKLGRVVEPLEEEFDGEEGPSEDNA